MRERSMCVLGCVRQEPVSEPGRLGTISAPHAGCSEAGRGNRVGVTFPYISCSSALPLWGPWD